MTKYFITKDFIGFPTDVVSATYDSGGFFISGHFYAPKKLSKKFPGFDSLDEILVYKMCNCGKDDCKVNRLLKEIVENKKINNHARSNDSGSRDKVSVEK